MRGIITASLSAMVTMALAGCIQTEVGDFKRISYNGWESIDNLRDKNDYAWSMKFYQPDGGAEGQLYVGSGNNVLGLVVSQLEAILLAEDELIPPIYAPEVRRYQPGSETRTWESVLDYKDVMEEGDEIFGFRYLQEYRSLATGKKHLYAATMGNNAILWRSESGDPGTWERFWESGENGSIRYVADHNGIMYIALATDIPFVKDPGEIWASDGEDVWPVVRDGFGNPENRGFQFLTSWNGWLYTGTNNPVEGYEIWKFAGPESNLQQGDLVTDGVPLITGGGPSDINVWAATPAVFKGHLYVGSMIPIGFEVETGKGFKGTDIVRIAPDDSWEVVVGPDSLSGYGSGFDRLWNVYCWQMAEHEGTLYASTFDLSTIVRFGASMIPATLDSLPEVLLAGLRVVLNGGIQGTDYGFEKPVDDKELGLPLNDVFNFGADIYKSVDGVNWEPLTTDGLGHPRNYGFRTMQSVGDTFYLGSANAFEGLQIWEAQGTGSFSGNAE